MSVSEIAAGDVWQQVGHLSISYPSCLASLWNFGPRIPKMYKYSALVKVKSHKNTELHIYMYMYIHIIGNTI